MTAGVGIAPRRQRMRARQLQRWLGWKVRLALAGVVALSAVVIVFRVTQPRTTPLRVAEQGAQVRHTGEFESLLELYTGTHVVAGNAVEPLLNGVGTYPRLWADLAAATQSITIQSYYAQPGAVADTLSRILRARARRGVQVLCLFDAFGSNALTNEWYDSLRAAGVRVALLRPLRWQSLHDAASRSHVRALVIDGRIGYTGGFGFADYWQGGGERPREWRETNVRVEGPAVLQLQAAFGAAWMEATGELLSGPPFFPATAPAGPRGTRAAILYTTPSTGTTSAERFLVLAVLSAQRRLLITNSYFVPNADFRELLADAVRRGVDVRVLTAGPRTDVKSTRFAARYQYEGLLRDGIRVYEYEAAMMHAKTLTVDDAWTAIGSMNFDNRSLAFNDESLLIAFDSVNVQRMSSAFADDLRRSREITLGEFRRRRLGERLLELAAHLLTSTL